MSRGPLDEATLISIAQRLPAFDPWADWAVALHPDFISIAFPHESEIPVASVALSDCAHTLYATRFALHEYLACGIYFRQHAEPLNEMLAVHREIYYLDDAALRLYSAAEHLAEAVRCMLDRTDSDLAPYRKRGMSRWARIAAYLEDKHPTSPITHAFASLSNDEDWRLAIRYRGAWVHNQPPTIHGLGLIYQRQKKWQKLPDGGWRLAIRRGETPEFTTDQLGAAFIAAIFRFADVFRVVLGHYEATLEAAGISFEERK